jgi:response regulator RpfG family c-di-GMP phosphodiesterase
VPFWCVGTPCACCAGEAIPLPARILAVADEYDDDRNRSNSREAQSCAPSRAELKLIHARVAALAKAASARADVRSNQGFSAIT